jgi:hypothetical protein
VLPKQIVVRSSKAMQPLQRLAARGAQAPGPAAAEAVLDLGFDPEDWAPMDVVMIFGGSMCNRLSDFNTDPNRSVAVALLPQHQGQRLLSAIRRIRASRSSRQVRVLPAGHDRALGAYRVPSRACRLPDFGIMGRRGDPQRSGEPCGIA